MGPAPEKLTFGADSTGSENVAVTVIVSNGLTMLSASLSVSITFRVFISITLDETDEHKPWLYNMV